MLSAHRQKTSPSRFAYLRTSDGANFPVNHTNLQPVEFQWIAKECENAFQFSMNRATIHAELNVDLSSIETPFMLNRKTTAYELRIYTV